MSEETQSKRKRKCPDRFGDALVGHSSEESEHDFSDNSMDDRDYSPESPKVVATVKRTRLDIDVVTPIESDENFDEFFAEIDKQVIEKESNCNSVSSHEKRSADACLTEPIELFETKVDIEMENSDFRSDLIVLKDLLIRLNEKTDEVAARLAVLERDHYIEKSQNDHRLDHKTKVRNEHDKYAPFIQSIGLPFSDLRDLHKFENNLNDFKYSASVVC